LTQGLLQGAAAGDAISAGKKQPATDLKPAASKQTSHKQADDTIKTQEQRRTRTVPRAMINTCRQSHS
jgi:hypothetical protein